MGNPSEHLAHLVAPFVSADNSWSMVDSHYIGSGHLIPSVDMQYVRTIRSFSQRFRTN